MFRFLIHYLTAFLFVLVVACGDDNSASSEDDVLSSDSEVAGSSVSDYPESSNAEMGSSSNVDVPSSSSDAVPSSSSADASSSSEEKSSSSYVQRSHVIKDSSVYFEAENRLLDLRDSQEYRTVVIGEQTWMAQNLNYAYLESVYDQDSSSWCYNNEQDSCTRYGRLYFLEAAVDGKGLFGSAGKDCIESYSCGNERLMRGICPSGWHLPSKEEFEKLIEYAGGKKVSGKKLKSTEEWENEKNGTDDFGFGALPAGDIAYREIMTENASSRNTLGKYSEAIGSSTGFWTSAFIHPEYEKDIEGYAFLMSLGDDVATHLLSMGFRPDNSYSIRCLKDND